MMLGGTPGGDAYTFTELETMFRNAGFAQNPGEIAEGINDSVTWLIVGLEVGGRFPSPGAACDGVYRGFFPAHRGARKRPRHGNRQDQNDSGSAP